MQDDIFIYTTKINFNISDMDFKKALNSLSKEEQNRIIAKKDYKSRCESLTSALTIKNAIKDVLGIRESCFQVKRNIMNRPYIESNGRFYIDFNVSHSREWVVCAISSMCKIGIDIEEILPIDINIAKEFLSNEEWKFLIGCKEERVKLFYKFWTLKESFFKAVGIGINDLIKEVNFGRLDNKKNIFEKEINRDIWNFYNTTFNKNYALSLSINKPIKSIKFISYNEL